MNISYMLKSVFNTYYGIQKIFVTSIYVYCSIVVVCYLSVSPFHSISSWYVTFPIFSSFAVYLNLAFFDHCRFLYCLYLLVLLSPCTDVYKASKLLSLLDNLSDTKCGTTAIESRHFFVLQCYALSIWFGITTFIQDVIFRN